MQTIIPAKCAKRIGVLARFATAIIATVLLAGCGSGGTWVDVPFTDAKDFAAIKKDPESKKGFELMARATCGNVGKTYTGEFRLKNGGVQIKCK